MSKKTITTVYNALPALLLPWFYENARTLPWRADKNPYHVWLSEIMLQQTRVEAVRGYYTRFLSAFPTISALAGAEEETILKLWEGLGYYSRARNLLKAARIVENKYGGLFPSAHRDILALPGIGAYTAGAISSICFEAPEPAVDGNVLRVISRATNSTVPIDSPHVKNDITEQLRRIYPAGHCGDFTQSLMELGATVCVPKSPRCMLCPLSAVCLAKKAGTAELLPCKGKKKARRQEEKTVFVFTFENKIALHKREPDGLLAGLWELPNISGKLSAADAIRYAEALGLCPEAPSRSKERTHIFTHVEWLMTCYFIPCRQALDAYRWASREAISEHFALPTAFRMFLEDSDEEKCV